MQESNDVATAAVDREITISRLLDAPRELVFDAWTDPEHIAQWWGPKGFTNTVYEMDVRPGGVWRFMMHGPDGVDYPNKVVFQEIAKPGRISYSHGTGEEGDPGEFHVTVTFTEEGDRTRLTLHILFETAEEREKMAEFGAIEGGNQTLDRFEEFLVQEFVIERVLDAPRDLVWKAHTEPERMAKWWGPKGYTMLIHTMDLRPGGTYHYCMQAPNGSEMWGKFVYRDIVAPERMVFVSSFSDKDGNIVHHPMSPTWPLEMLTTLTLSEHNGKTTLTLRSRALNATEEERMTFLAGHDSMRKGFGGTLDQLAEYLANG